MARKRVLVLLVVLILIVRLQLIGELVERLMVNTCETCRYAGPRSFLDQHDCRRHAPVSNTVPHYKDIREHVPVWPIMRSRDWCGDHEGKNP